MRSVYSHLRSNVVAYLALFVALGGSSYAAFQLPRNSVTTRTLAPGAVTGQKVRNDSLRLADFAAKDRDRLRGHTGPAGPAGQDGQPGPVGPAGRDAVSLWFSVSAGGKIVDASQPATVAHMAGTGHYTVTAPRDVSRCTAQAAVATFRDEPRSYMPGIVALAMGRPNPAEVYLETYGMGGNPNDRPFSLLIVC